mmetsp:Transcript_30860/g.90195  ORF Transcript_30860/g.90195 Transcript_30860/m.90195 type:complete len:298 (-) Transcript_30860:127-1020(-)
MQDAALRKMRRRLSSGAMPRRASMEHATLHTIGERSRSSINGDNSDNDDYNQEPEGYRMQRRRSSVSFSDTDAVREYNPEPAETVAERFYSPEDIRQFRLEYRQERRMARRNSTGSAPLPVRKEGIASLTVGLDPQATAATGGGGMAYPYIGPYARTSPSTPNHYFSSDSVRTTSTTTSGPHQDSDANEEGGSSEGNGPIVIFSSPSGHHPKKPTDLSSTTCSASGFHPRYQRRHSVGPIQATGFTVPFDQIRTVMAAGTAGKEGQPASSSPHDLAAAQFVSVSCPMPRRPSTAGIA